MVVTNVKLHLSTALIRPRHCLSALLFVALFAAFASAPAHAAGPPIVGDTWATKVDARSAQLNAEIDPNGNLTGAFFEYATEAAHDANGFTGAKKVNLNDVGSGTGSNDVPFPLISGLTPDTTYVYQLTATNIAGSDQSSIRFFNTQALGGSSILLDGRGWEMVSPVDKNGGQVDPPGAIAGGGTLQAAANGDSITYGSRASFAGGEGAPPASQYLGTRTSGGWATENLTVPIFSGSYDTVEGGAPYRLFSGDLARGLLLNGKSCRSEATSGCPVPNPPLAGTDAPAGYQNYYMRDSGGDFEALLGSADIPGGIDADDFELIFAGAAPDLRTVVLSTCAALTVGASNGCPGNANLYKWSSAGGISLVNSSSPGATLAAQIGAISTNGGRVYFYSGGNLFLRDEGGALKQADAGAGGGGTFETASADGSVAFFSKGGHVWRYRSTTDSATDVTPSGGVAGVLGAAADGSHIYYLSGSGLQLCASAHTVANCNTASTDVADDADASNYPPATGTSRVSADGNELLFVATMPLTGFDNLDADTKDPDSQVYLYDGDLTCVSCNPTNGRPIGPSTIPGAIVNGAGPTATVAYKPRVLSSDGRRVFFESDDALALTDTNSDATDAYQWEAQGKGDCDRAGGCLALISSGRDAGGAQFVDASADGDDAFFLTAASLVTADLGGTDLYDARVGGGFSDPVDPIPCTGDTCQILPPEPTDPTLTTLLAGPGNPPAKYTRYKHRFKKPQKRCRQRDRKKRRACQKRNANKRKGRSSVAVLPGGGR